MNRLSAGLTILALTLAAYPAAAARPPRAMVFVPEGEFPMGNPWSKRYPNELPVHVVELDAFWIDVFEVTNAEYARVLNWANERYVLREKDNSVYKRGDVYFAGRLLIEINRSDLRYDEDRRRFFVAPRSEQPMFDHPVTMVSWYGAANYCNWLSEMESLTPCYTGLNAKHVHCNFAADGYRLPTEAEWEKAASYDPWVVDPLSGPKQPFGMIGELDPRRANYWNPALEEFNNPVGLGSKPFTAPVGFYNGDTRRTIDSPSAWGCYDMSGNVYEWCWDWFDETYYSRSPRENPLGPREEDERAVRSGSWTDVPETLRSTRRAGWSPFRGADFLGFRTIRIPERPTDLVVEGFNFSPTEVERGDPIHFSGRVRSTGTKPVGPFSIGFKIGLVSGSNQICYTLAGAVRVKNGLRPGEYVDLSAIERTVSVQPDAPPTDSYTVCVVLDPLEEVDEADEDNNEMSVRNKPLTLLATEAGFRGTTRVSRWLLYW